MRLAKIVLRCLAAYAMAFILVSLIPEHIHRRDFDRAFFTWFKNRTPQNEAALRAEQHKNEIIRLQDSAVIALVVVVIAGGTYMIVRFVRRSSDKRRAIVR
jgi:hypothetical protein